MRRGRKTRRGLGWIVFLAAIVSIALNVKLLLAGQADVFGGIGGCGGGGCGDVLGSRWSKVFGIPVTLFGIFMHVGVLVGLTHRGRRLLVPLLGVVFGAALWFTVVQALVLQTFCPLCLTAHGVAVVECLAGWLLGGRRLGGDLAARQAVTWSMAGLLGIGLIQIYGPAPATHRVVPLVGADAATQQPIHAEGGGRMLLFESIQKSYAVESLPRIGKPTASHVFVEYLDYRCAACRITSGFVDALIARHPNEVAVLILPVPLESKCNPLLSPLAGQHPGSCELARLALAVWRENPVKFPDFHRQRMLDPSLDAAERDARALIPQERFEAALADPWIDRLLEANISDWLAFSRDSDKLPKLLIPTGKIVHGPPSGEADFIRRLEQELGLTPTP